MYNLKEDAKILKLKTYCDIYEQWSIKSKTLKKKAEEEGEPGVSVKKRRWVGGGS